MAEEKKEEQASSSKSKGAPPPAPQKKCPPCKPGLPGWLATYADMVTLLLTFFVLLLSFAKTETSKSDSVLGSIRNALGGSSLKQGEVFQLGKSPSNEFTMFESPEIPRPFPIDFLTLEGFLDKLEINRDSDETLKYMKNDVKEYELDDSVEIYEESEGVRMEMKDKIYFEAGSIKIKSISVPVFDRMVKLLKERNWVVVVEGHSSKGEVDLEDNSDAIILSAKRSAVVAKSLARRGIRPDKIINMFYGDTRPDLIVGKPDISSDDQCRRVEFVIRKMDYRKTGHKVQAQ